ncbi:MAG: ABC transporter permease, partial [Sulfurimonadaceae bacterium]|nr:ABC transporter permease [Sulfurimonadaceae bacterium]
VFILIMSMALKDTFGSDHALLSYAVVDSDGTEHSGDVAAFLRENSSMQEHNLTATGSAALQKALNEEVQFVLTIPEGFSEKVTDDGYEGSLLELDAASDVKQEMLTLFKAQLAMAVMQQRLGKLKGELEPFAPQAADALGKMEFNDEDMVTVRFNAMAADEKPTSTQQSVPSWIVFGMFFVIIPMSTIFINERKQNTLMRMSAMNISVPALFAGKIAPYIVINQIQVWLMIAVGMYIVPLLGADALTLGNSIGGLFMVSLGLSLAAIGTSVLIAVTVGTVEQATTIGGIINILMGAVGGIMVPKFVMPPAMQSFADISPMSWGLEGFLDIFLRGLGAADVVIESLALAGFGLGMLFSAAVIFILKTRRGV